jgi:Tol biopolymer transport system component
VVRADGSQLTRITPEPLSEIGAVSFSPDGRRLLLHATVDSAQSILVAAVDGSGVRKLDVGRLAVAVGWRPPLGDEILFTDAPISNDEIGFYAIHPDGGPVRTILPYAPGQGRGGQIWSPDGTRIAYFDYESDLTTVRTHIINADGTGDRVLALPSEAAWEAPVAWSNDGTRLLSIRGFDDGYSTSRAVARPVDGTDTGIEIDAPGALQQGCCISAEWAPDDTSILVAPTNAARESIEQVMLDVKTGTTSGVPWSTTSIPTWQRRAD